MLGMPSPICWVHYEFFKKLELDARNTLGFGNPNISNLSRHFAITHQGDTTNFIVTGIERVKKSPKGGDLKKKKNLLSPVARWIINLETRTLHRIFYFNFIYCSFSNMFSCIMLYVIYKF